MIFSSEEVVLPLNSELSWGSSMPKFFLAIADSLDGRATRWRGSKDDFQEPRPKLTEEFLEAASETSGSLLVR